MTRGRRICGVLKTIRKQVADANEIKYEPRECHHQGECRGTCPACEAEVRYIEQQLNIRRQLGKAVAIVGISAGLSALTGCGVKAKKADSISDEKSKLTDGKMMVENVETVDGDVEYRSPVDTVIIEKDPATIKKRTAPFKAPETKQETGKEHKKENAAIHHPSAESTHRHRQQQSQNNERPPRHSFRRQENCRDIRRRDPSNCL